MKKFKIFGSINFIKHFKVLIEFTQETKGKTLPESGVSLVNELHSNFVFSAIRFNILLIAIQIIISLLMLIF